MNLLFEQESDGSWSASCPSLPGVYSDGATLKDARINILQALGVTLETYFDQNMPIPWCIQETVVNLNGSIEESPRTAP